MKKINRIILFGDSFIQGVGCYHKLENDGRMNYNTIPTEDIEQIIRHRNLSSWEYLKNYFPNVEVINYGINGSSNYESYELLSKFIVNEYKDTDLILLGFTSKLRDFPRQFNFIFNLPGSELLKEDNPILVNPISFDKYQKRNFLEELDDSFSDKEKIVTEEFKIKFINDVYNDEMNEYISNTNYLFLQTFVENYDINLICFDLFEKYISNDVKFNINKDIYINYNGKSMFEYLLEYESKFGFPILFKPHMKYTVSYFEKNNSFLDELDETNIKVTHLNQIGYQVYIDYFCEEFLLKKYK